MYPDNILDYLCEVKQKLRSKTWTISRLLDFTPEDMRSIQRALNEDGIHSQLQEDLLTAWVN